MFMTQHPWCQPSFDFQAFVRSVNLGHCCFSLQFHSQRFSNFHLAEFFVVRILMVTFDHHLYHLDVVLGYSDYFECELLVRTSMLSRLLIQTIRHPDAKHSQMMNILTAESEYHLDLMAQQSFRELKSMPNLHHDLKINNWKCLRFEHGLKQSAYLQ